MVELNILPNGNVETLYTDKINLQEVGKLEVFRASNVEFDNEKQGWMVNIIATNENFGPFESRQEALEAEVKFLNTAMEKEPGYSLKGK